MSAIIIPFETRAQRENRLYREVMAAFDTYSAVHTRTALDALVDALDRLVFDQKRRRPYVLAVR